MGYLLVIGAIFAWLILPEGAISQTVLSIWFVVLLICVSIWLFLAR
jgi:hypothetical protein